MAGSGDSPSCPLILMVAGDWKFRGKLPRAPPTWKWSRRGQHGPQSEWKPMSGLDWAGLGTPVPVLTLRGSLRLTTAAALLEDDSRPKRELQGMETRI